MTRTAALDRALLTCEVKAKDIIKQRLGAASRDYHSKRAEHLHDLGIDPSWPQTRIISELKKRQRAMRNAARTGHYVYSWLRTMQINLALQEERKRGDSP